MQTWTDEASNATIPDVKMLNIAIVGLGYWGPNFARIIEESENASLTWCCDLSRESLLKIKSRYKNSLVTTNLDDVLNDKRVDAVIVAVPAIRHYEVVKKVLLAGKDVLVEKPLSTSVSEAQELVKLAKTNQRILMVDHIFLFNPGVRKVKELIDKGELGKIFYGHGTYTALGPIRIDVSAMWDLSIHFIYTICYLLNEYPKSISAFGRGFLVEKNADVAFLNLEFGKKTIFNLKVSWLDPVKTRSLVIVGDKKMVVFDDALADKICLFDRGVDYGVRNGSLPPEGYQFMFRYGDIVLPHIPTNEPLREVFDDFINSVKSRKESVVSVLDAVNTITLLEAAGHSLKNSGKPIYFTSNKRTGLLSYKLV